MIVLPVWDECFASSCGVASKQPFRHDCAAQEKLFLAPFDCFVDQPIVSRGPMRRNNRPARGCPQQAEGGRIVSQSLGVEPVGLGPAMLARYRNARGVDHMSLDCRAPVSHRANQKPSGPASKATAMRVIAWPAFQPCLNQRKE